jgi:hypothetical protein
MTGSARIGGGIVGLVFLALGLLKLLQGGHWVVWMVLGVLFGGVSAASALVKGRAR